MKLGLLGSEIVFTCLPSEIMDWKFQPLKTEVELENKDTKKYVDGFKFYCTLDFSGWISAAQYEALRAVFNLGYSSGNILSFYLNEILYPNLRLNVRWDNEWNFKPISKTDWGYFSGQIILVGSDVLTAVPAMA